MEINFDNVTQFINQANIKNDEVLNELFELLYTKIKFLANIQLNKLNPDQSISPTQLVHECYLKLIHSQTLSLKDRNHFYAVSAKCMRFYLVDTLKKSNHLKNKGVNTELKLTEFVSDDNIDLQLLDLDFLLNQLELINEELSSITELRIFGGFTFEEIADIKNEPKSSIYNKWRMANAYLKDLSKECE